MSLQFDKYYFLFLLFTSDLKKVVLQKNNDKLEPIVIEINKDEQANFSKISTFFLDTYKIKLNHELVRIVASIPQLDKTSTRMIVMTLVDDISEYEQNSNFKVAFVDDLPRNCFPILHWIVPLCVDPSIYGSCFNQIIMK